MTTAEEGFVVGIDLGGTKIDIATGTPGGEPIERTRLSTEADRGAAQALERALIEAELLIAATGETARGCLAAAVVSPGIADRGKIRLAPNLPGIEEISLAQVTHARLSVPTVVANDVKAGAFAEARHGNLVGANPAVFLNLGTGLAAALVIDGEVVTGAHGAAGEIGYSLRDVSDLIDGVGGRAPLEEMVSGRAIGERASLALGRHLSAAAAFEHEAESVRAVIDDALDELAMTIANLSVLVDPDRIALAGGLTGSDDALADRFRERVAHAVPFPPEIVTARFSHDAGLRGALALAAARARTDAPVDLEPQSR